MIHSGLVSVTFRKLSPAEIVKLVCRAKLEAVEWGGDIHVPHGNVKAAVEVARMTAESGLVTAAYGSYYIAGSSEENGLPFARVLETAVALGAPVIRVWAGDKGSADADDRYRNMVAEDSVRIADLALKEDIRVAFEYHAASLTDSRDSTEALLKAASRENLRCCWQPAVGRDMPDRIADLTAVASRLENVHVYHWKNGARLALAEGTDEWRRYFTVMSGIPGDRYALLEFVNGDSPDRMLEDAQTLKEALKIENLK